MQSKSKKPTPEEAQQMAQLVAVLYEAIKDSGPNGLPSGVLYAIVQSAIPGWNLAAHSQAIQVMVRTGYITSKNHLLVAVAQ